MFPQHVVVPPERIQDAPEGGGRSAAAARYSVDDAADATAGGGGGEVELPSGLPVPEGDATVGVDVIACTACGASLSYTRRWWCEAVAVLVVLRQRNARSLFSQHLFPCFTMADRSVVTAQEVPLTDLTAVGNGGEGASATVTAAVAPVYGAGGGGIQALQHAAIPAAGAHSIESESSTAAISI